MGKGFRENVLDGVRARWAIRENTLVFYGETFGGICDARVGCFVGPRLPRRYNEASFTFATCTALAVRYSLGLEEWAYTLLYYGPQTRGSWQTAGLSPLPQSPR
jgi:hypothetical protein